MIEHYEFNGFTPTSTDDDKILELGDIELINNAKKLQEKAEQKYKTEVLNFLGMISKIKLARRIKYGTKTN